MAAEADEASQNISGVLRAAEGTSAASTQLLACSEDLSAQAGFLSDKMSEFVASLRAA